MKKKVYFPDHKISFALYIKSDMIFLKSLSLCFKKLLFLAYVDMLLRSLRTLRQILKLLKNKKFEFYGLILKTPLFSK